MDLSDFQENENPSMNNQIKKNSFMKSETGENIYYGVHVPNSLEIPEDIEKTNVFTDKLEALKLLKKFKKARFKAFNYYHEAVEFVIHGGEVSVNNQSFLSNNSKKEPEKENLSTVVNEKYQFRGPKSQDLIRLRKAIETNDLNYVEKTIWDNPRYLISSGDTPSILQEGSRYNALHIAAKAKHAEMCELILNTVSNTEFIEKLYGEDGHQNSEDRAKILLDLYLNMPDKGVNETPLHFAVKFGALKVIEVLVSFPQCDRNVRNKYGKLPNQIICERCDGYTSEKLKEQIATLLEDNFYVPVLRYEGNCTPPIIGKPFSPKSPPSFDIDPLKPRVEIHAYAGPMEKKEADKFRKIWKTPPRSITNLALNQKRLSNSADSGLSYNLKLRDPEKGLEAVGRELATKYNVNWKEYWPFLDNFTDLCSEEGLKQFENYLSDRNEHGFINLNTPKRPDKPPNESKGDNSSFLDSLCRRFDDLCILDSSDDSISILNQDNDNYVCPYVCLERSLKIFANRISNIIKNRMKNGELNRNNLLSAEMKLFEQLIVSYLNDKRFANIDMQKAHARLAVLIVQCLIKENGKDLKLQEICFGNFEVIFSKHLECVLCRILVAYENEINFNEDNYKEIWESSEKCQCVFIDKQSNKFKYSLRRKSNGVKSGNNNNNNFYNGSISKDLFKVKSCNNEIKNESVSEFSSSSSEDDEEYFTPPSSPSFIEDEMKMVDDVDGDEVYDESRLPEIDVFIEGSEPSKIDRDVYNALKYASTKINPKDFPNIYKWRHTVSLFTEEERERWSNPKSTIITNDIHIKTSTPCRGTPLSKGGDSSFNSPLSHASPKSWFRITGLNSPRASLNTFKSNLSFNL